MRRRSAPEAVGCRTRAAVHRDLRAVAAIERAVFPDPWSHGMFVAHLRYAPPEMFLVAEDATGEVIGYALTRTVIDEAELLNIAVAPGARRRGTGVRLLRAAMETCRAHGAEVMLLEVRESNVAARTLYERHGFVPVGRRVGYYHSPREDAIVMRAPLVDPADRAGLGAARQESPPR
jgi:ribosomal-protein-alanine N-acetyltransferase